MEPEERKDKIETLRRYEATRREQLGAAVNLIFGLAAAGVGFCVSRIGDKDAHFSSPGTYFFLAAMVAFLATVGLCMLTTWTRLRDFRLTAERIRAELRDRPHVEIQRLRAQADSLGIRTWFLFRAQSASFFIGVALLAVSLWLLYQDRLFPKNSSATAPSPQVNPRPRDFPKHRQVSELKSAPGVELVSSANLPSLCAR